MTPGQLSLLCRARIFDFKRHCKTLGFKCEGPSARGCFLVYDGSKVRLFGPWKLDYFGRTAIPSVWTPLNVAVMRQESTEGL